MEGLSLDLPLLLQAVNDVLVSPANLMGQTLQNVYSVILRLPLNIMCSIITYLDSAVFAARLQSQYTQSSRDNHPLLTIIGRGNAFEKFQAFQSGSSAGRLVRNHATDGLEEDL